MALGPERPVGAPEMLCWLNRFNKYSAWLLNDNSNFHHRLWRNIRSMQQRYPDGRRGKAKILRANLSHESCVQYRKVMNLFFQMMASIMICLDSFDFISFLHPDMQDSIWMYNDH